MQTLTASIRPHDLLEIASASLLTAEGISIRNQPEWVVDALSLTPFVVARRSFNSPELIAVGVRGSSRAQRFGAFVAASAIRKIIKPEDLLSTSLNAPCTEQNKGALDTLRQLHQSWSDTSLRWGPGGSAGFELATGIPTLTPSSDLDIVLYADKPISTPQLQWLVDSLPKCRIKIDIQIETHFCGFSLSEYLNSKGQEILLKSWHGPVLAKDPWAETYRANSVTN